MKEGKSVVVDNTNPSISARADFLDLASKTGNYKHIWCITIFLAVTLILELGVCIQNNINIAAQVSN